MDVLRVGSGAGRISGSACRINPEGFLLERRRGTQRISHVGRGGHRSRMDAREREAERIAGSIGWREARAAHAEGRLPAAELGCIYIAERVHRAAGNRWLQGERRQRLEPSSASPWVRLFAERELCRVPSPVARALVAWA